MPPRRGTPWVSSRGSLVSDRIRPSGPSQPAKSEKGLGKGNGKGGGGKVAAAEPPPSTAVRRLDELIAGFTTTTTAVVMADRDACFCQARVHDLSEYTPICTSCGLVLCAQQPPYRACTHCGAPLLSPPAHNALVAQLEELRAQTLAEEEEAREKEEEALRVAEGAFPALGGSGTAPSGGSTTGGKGKGGGVTAGPGAGRRVLSVDSRTKRVRVESYGGLSRATGNGDGGEEEQAEGDGVDAPLSRVPPPPREVEYARVQRGPATRWVDLKGGGGAAKYVAPPAHTSHLAR